MSIDPIACTLLAAASVSTGFRRARKGKLAQYLPNVPDRPTSIAAQRHHARLLNIPDSAIDRCLEEARQNGQSERLAMRNLLAGGNMTGR